MVDRGASQSGAGTGPEIGFSGGQVAGRREGRKQEKKRRRSADADQREAAAAAARDAGTVHGSCWDAVAEAGASAQKL